MKFSKKKLGILLIIIAAILAIRLTGVHHFLTFKNLQQNKLLLQGYVARHYVQALAAFIVIYMLIIAASIPGGTIMTLAGGFLFGTIVGALAVNVGATAGAFAAFLLSRYILGGWLQNRYKRQLESFNRELEQNGYLYLLTLRFIPLFPFFMINFFSGLTKIPARTYLWTTAVGILPGSLVYTFAGSQIGSINSPGDILSGRLILAFVLLGLLALVPVIYKKVKAKSPMPNTLE